jgi:hypothetical protein
MYSQISKLVLTLGTALSLGACASLTGAHVESPSAKGDRLAQAIQPGLTQAAVRSAAGAPSNVTGSSRSGEKQWIYSITDDWGYPADFEVTFNGSGVVESTYTERLEY